MEENVREMEQWKRREAERYEVRTYHYLYVVYPSCLQQEVKRSVEPLVAELNKIQQEKLTMEQVVQHFNLYTLRRAGHKFANFMRTQWTL